MKDLLFEIRKKLWACVCILIFVSVLGFSIAFISTMFNISHRFVCALTLAAPFVWETVERIVLRIRIILMRRKDKNA